ncbi:hypothetical protein BKA70DRAFT_506769 [Coprinopsis sp. MPI-PUGE-AT-0042]|nr:hypothetical protein BKA70DRAFT_506769 [Coprinopsis sp. MPI-PUGE-AT-0042]
MVEQSPYAFVHVPLIQSPSLRVPQKVELPPDIHPLPESVTPYFVYPFTLENHILVLESSRRTTIAAHSAKREEYLKHRDSEKERRKRDALRRIAPGFEPQGVLVPQETGAALRHKGSHSMDARGPHEGRQEPRSVMDDLVDQLAALDASKSSPPPQVYGAARPHQSFSLPPPPPPPPSNQPY